MSIERVEQLIQRSEFAKKQWHKYYKQLKACSTPSVSGGINRKLAKSTYVFTGCCKELNELGGVTQSVLEHKSANFRQP